MRKGKNIYFDVQRELALEKFSLNEKIASGVKKNAGICIFLSHKSSDKDYVRKVQNFINEFGIDTYLDEEDERLQVAVSTSDDKKITESIQIGIENSTHIMCFASKETVSSWWVPYEIGYADCNNKKISTLRINDIKSSEVPSYLKIHDFLNNRHDLLKYIENIYREGDSLYQQILLDEMYEYASSNKELDKAYEDLKKYID